MRAILIDDEKHAISSLEMELKGLSQSIEIIGRANSVASGLNLLEENVPDVVFLDIKMTDGSGFDVLERMPNLDKIDVVFTTAYDKYAIQALKSGAYDYLLKPIDPDELQQTVDRIARGIREESEPKILESKNQSAHRPFSETAKIALNTTDGIYLKKIKDIIRIQSDGNYTKIFFDGKDKPMLIAKTLKDYEELLSSSKFVRIHSSHLINLFHLDSYHHKEGGHVIMSNKEMLPVSKRKKSNLLEILKNEGWV